MEMSSRVDISIYCLLYTSVTLVNKHVLSDLGFRYPTVFQGWQTFAGAVVFILFSQAGKIQLDLSTLNGQYLIAWLPYFVLYVLQIYSGSIALANLPVAVFLSAHNINNVLNLMVDKLFINSKVLTPREFLSSSIILVSVLFIARTDESSSAGYLWMAFHISVTIILVNYSKLRRVPKLRDTQLLFLCYTFSVAFLMPSSIIFGDLQAAAEFPFLRQWSFYAGCMLSGVCGACFKLHWFFVKEHISSTLPYPISIRGLGKLTAVCAALVAFPHRLNQNSSHLLWAFANLVCGVLLTDVTVQNESPMKPSLSNADMTTLPELNGNQWELPKASTQYV